MPLSALQNGISKTLYALDLRFSPVTTRWESKVCAFPTKSIDISTGLWILRGGSAPSESQGFTRMHRANSREEGAVQKIRIMATELLKSVHIGERERRGKEESEYSKLTMLLCRPHLHLIFIQLTHKISSRLYNFHSNGQQIPSFIWHTQSVHTHTSAQQCPHARPSACKHCCVRCRVHVRHVLSADDR